MRRHRTQEDGQTRRAKSNHKSEYDLLPNPSLPTLERCKGRDSRNERLCTCTKETLDDYCSARAVKKKPLVSRKM
jgi:hypothetical protein